VDDKDMGKGYDTSMNLSRSDFSIFNDAVEMMLKELKHILDSTSVNSIEKIITFVRYQCFECIKLFNFFKNSLSGYDEFDFFTEYNILVSQKVKEYYFALFDECIRNLYFDASINKELIFETIQDVIIYFTQLYHETKKISASLEYLEEAIELLISGLKKGSGVVENKLQVI
jgi:hypothetical protein